jgi:hypothetical protein
MFDPLQWDSLKGLLGSASKYLPPLITPQIREEYLLNSLKGLVSRG